jgi:prolyl oligopeptidase
MSEALDRLGDDYWEATLRHNPTLATYLGDFRYNDRLADLSDAGRAAWRTDALALLGRAAKIDRASLTEADRVTLDVLVLQLENSLEEQGHRFFTWAVDQMMGPQSDFPQLMNFHPASDVPGLEARFRAFPAYLAQYLDNLRAGVREGRTAIRPAVERVVGQLKALLATPPEKSPFAVAPSLLPAIRDAVYPAFASMLACLESGYPARSERLGLSALPDGAEAYRYCIRQHTTTEHSAEEIHRIGLEEVASIREEMKSIAKGDVGAFMAKLKADPANFFRSREELLEAARSDYARCLAALPRAFSRLPRTGCEVKAIEEYRERDSVGAFYYPPDEKLTRKGIYYANTFGPERRPRFNLRALTVHEAVPGHHLQIALAMELEGIPRFRRQSSFTAYVEGWALYSERLADELGLYEDDLQRFGMLTYQAWRAARLVVDTGLHALGWTREQAIRYFMDHIALSETEVLNEVDRYLIWPGQALAYMMGKREIWALREEARASLGARFDLKAFHDVVLRNGALPLPTLRTLVKDWAGS